MSRKRTGRDFDLAQLCAYLGESGFHSDAHVRRAAHNVGQLRLAGVDLQKMELL